MVTEATRGSRPDDGDDRDRDRASVWGAIAVCLTLFWTAVAGAVWLLLR
jgi:hypothetical protein